MLKKLAMALGFLTFSLMAAPLPVQAEILHWRVRNMSIWEARLKFFERDGSGVWPSSDRSYLLNDEGVHHYNLECDYGDWICYGAYVEDTDFHWGVGRYGTEGCDDCCYRCTGGSTPVRTLTD